MRMLRFTSAQFRERLGVESKSKYRNKKTVVDGIEFDSKKEATRYLDLAQMQRSGQIANLRRQVPFPINVNGQLICVYVADFVYDRRPISIRVIEDTKGFRTEAYMLKRKLVAALYNIEILET